MHTVQARSFVPRSTVNCCTGTCLCTQHWLPLQCVYNRLILLLKWCVCWQSCLSVYTWLQGQQCAMLHVYCHDKFCSLDVGHYSFCEITNLSHSFTMITWLVYRWSGGLFTRSQISLFKYPSTLCALNRYTNRRQSLWRVIR